MQCDNFDADFDEVTFFFFGVALLLTVLFFFIASRKITYKPIELPEELSEESDAEDFLPMLSQRATLYGAAWCGFTDKQLSTLGLSTDDLHGLEYVNCDNDSDTRCQHDGIEAFPTWKIDGQYYTGYKTVDELKQLLR